MNEEISNITGPEDLLGYEIDGCRLDSILGYGSYGVVYLARHLMMDRLFALKILQDEFSSDKSAVENFFRECRTAAKLEHPNVVQAIKAGRNADGICYFVMEYVDGSSIENIRIHNPELLSLEFLLDISIQLADALDYAWETRQIIHRDIKPGNLLVSRDGQTLKLADLGLAGAGMSSGGDIVATPLYMAPEVAAGLGSREPASDIYSFGVMFYELVSGTPPFIGSVEELQRAHLEDTPPPLISVNPDLDPELAAFIDSMLSKNPFERPGSWAEVKERLLLFKNTLFAPERFVPQNVTVELPEEQDIDDIQKQKTALWYIGIAAVLVLLLGLIAAFLVF